MVRYSRIAVGVLSVLSGCSDTLETGYVPRKLGTSSIERRGYYASPFSPEATAAAEAARDSDGPPVDMRKPGGGYRGP